MAKAVYRAVRTSQFMPFDQGNKWIVTEPNGDIVHDLAGSYDMKQNEAIQLAKDLNSGIANIKDIKETFCINRN